MATIMWTDKAEAMRRKLYLNGIMEFGPTTAKKTAHTIENIAEDLAKWPTSGFPEPLLNNLTILFRARHINKRFKIIYRYDEKSDIVYIEDIWDTRRSPENLTKRVEK